MHTKKNTKHAETTRAKITLAKEVDIVRIKKVSLYSTFTAVFISVLSLIFPYQTVRAYDFIQNTAVELIGQPAVIWPQIKAESAYVYDPISNTVLYSKNADQIRPIASLNKLMTAAVADDLLRQSIPLSQKILQIVKYKDSNRADTALVTGTYWNPEDLIKYMLVGSSNKAAETVASELIPRESYLSLMNFTAKRLGLKKTYFYNPTGLSEYRKVNDTVAVSAGGISTAKEVAEMMWRIIEQHPGLLEITQLQNVSFSNGMNAFSIENTNKILNTLPIVVSKTGYTDLAGGNLAVVLQTSKTAHAYVIVVLGSTEEERFTDVYALASTTLSLAHGR